MAQSLPAVQLGQVLSETLSPYEATRKEAEARLQLAQLTPGHPLEVLRLIASSDGVDPAVRQGAAVHFKNLVKKGWDPERDEGNEGIVISVEDRNTIKSHLVQLMCTTPAQIQLQLSESIALISKVDYYQNWQNLLGELVTQFNSTDIVVVIGVLKTANSIFRSFRYVQRSDQLYTIIKYTLEGVQAPLLALFKSIGHAVEALANDRQQLLPRLEALRLMCRIFFSLNYQDLPEFFEDHMGEWMEEFAKYLQYNNPVVVDQDEESEAGPIDMLQAAVIENLQLYAGKDEEPFMEYLPQFTSLVWNRLTAVSAYPKHDALATTAIRFLSSLIQKQMHEKLFQDEATLRQIVLKIVIPNLLFRASDEEHFEDDPHEYMITEVEGSDNNSRRKCSQDLLRAMCRHFETQTTSICAEQVNSMLQEYATDPTQQWRAKDAAIHLMMGIAIRKESNLGVSEVNPHVDVMDFFRSQIVQELQDSNHSTRPVVKATSIKFVSVFRNQFARDDLSKLLPLLIEHLGSHIIVVHTFAAYAIERLLVTQDETNGVTRSKIGGTELQPVLNPLFTQLFAIIDNTEHNENDYVMKCVMRSLATVGQDVVPVTQIVITKLTSALGRVAKNPRNPQFNHYLFESIAVLIRSVCPKDPNAAEMFEGLLFGPFHIVLQMDIAEFTPYVFQILAQLLENRPKERGLGTAYRQLFPPLLTPTLWEKRGNIPALARLMQAYIQQGASELLGSINPILGIFQKLLSLNASEGSAFEILIAAVMCFPREAMDAKLPTIFQLLLTRLQMGKTKTTKFPSLVTQFFAFFVGKFGATAFVARLDAIQSGLTMVLVAQVWNPRIQSDPPHNVFEVKTQIVGLTKLLCETPAFIENLQLFGKTLETVVKLLSASTVSAPPAKTAQADEVDFEIGYDAQFSQLYFARKPTVDYFPELSNPVRLFVESLHQLSVQHPGRIQAVVQQGGLDPKVAVGLEKMFQETGMTL